MCKLIAAIFLIYFFLFNLPLYSFDKISQNVTIYSTGVSVINESYNVESINEQVSLAITIPANTVQSTINTFNLENQQILLEQENISKLLHKNDSVTILLENGSTFKGFVLNDHGWDPGDGAIILNVESISDKNKYENNPIIIIDDKKIISVQINELANGEEFDYRQKELQKVNISGISKAKDIIVSYVTRKTFSWFPAYIK